MVEECQISSAESAPTICSPRSSGNASVSETYGKAGYMKKISEVTLII